MNKRIAIDFAIPLGAAIFFTAVLYLIDADMEIVSWFYSPASGWFWGSANPWHWLYEYGNIPALLMSGGGLLVFVLSLFRSEFVSYRKVGLFLITLMLLGPGLLVNAGFKDHWGRPRPADIVNFGGTETFRQAWEPGQPGHGKSFPSGHAAVGFFLFSPFFILRKTSKGWAAIFLLLGIIYGTLMGTGRVIQGGHFPTDVLWSGTFIYITGLILYYIFRFDRISQPLV